MADRRPIASRSSALIQPRPEGWPAPRSPPNQISTFSVNASGLVPVGVLCLAGWSCNLLAAIDYQLSAWLPGKEGARDKPVGEKKPSQRDGFD